MIIFVEGFNVLKHQNEALNELWVIAGYKETIVEERFGGGQPNRTVLTLPLVGKEDLDVIKTTRKTTRKRIKNKKG